MKNKIKKIFKVFDKKQYPIRIYPQVKNIKGKVLFSYLSMPILAKDDDVLFKYHSNNWESREIVRIFTSLGFIVDVIEYNDFNFHPDCDYDIIFDIHYNLQRLISFFKKDIIKIFHITGSYPIFSNCAEVKRCFELEQRLGLICSPRRICDYILFDRSLRFADYCSLIGNEITLNTFPEKYRSKIGLLPVSSSMLGYMKRDDNEFISDQKEFLWFCGSGAVHKGLDLVLEVFSKNKNFVLNVIGGVEKEKDFYKAFKNLLFNQKNIKYHGFLSPDSEEFTEIIKRCFCFIAPSCSEGISPAVTTCLQIGLYPIISLNTGVTLPSGCGIYLNDCSIEEISDAIYFAYNKDEQYLKDEILSIQKIALEEYSRKNFSNKMKSLICKILSQRGII